MDEKTKIEVHNFQKGYLTLPFNQDQFQNFIKGLLGTPQTIRRLFRGEFEIQLIELQNFHDLIQQRVTQQNNGKLIQLTTEIFYSDSSSVVLGSYEELITYNEVKPVISLAVAMNWTYLIQFTGKTVPEKQEIDLRISTNYGRQLMFQDERIWDHTSGGRFDIEIRHTARSWGADIESLLSSQIQSILQPREKLKLFILRNNEKIGLITGLLFLFSGLFTIFLSNTNFNSNEIQKVGKYTASQTNLNEKFNYLLTYVASNTQNLFFIKSQLYTILLIIAAVILGTWVSSLASLEKRSFLTLTRESFKQNELIKKWAKRKFLMFWISIIISILSGIVSSYIFEFITKQ